MRKLILLLLVTSLVIVIQISSVRQAIGCDARDYQFIALVWAIAWTNPDYLPEVVEKNVDILNNSHWRNCIDRLANALRKGALAGPSPSEIREKAYEIAGEAGAPERGEGLYKDMIENRSDMLALASQFNSLSVSIRDIFEGNLSTYHNSYEYKTSTGSWQALENIWSHTPGAVDQWRRLFFSMFYWYIIELEKAMLSQN